MNSIESLVTPKTLLRLANIFDNAGQVFLAVTVLSPVVSGFDRVNWAVVVSGLLTTFILWIGSLYLTKIAQ